MTYVAQPTGSTQTDRVFIMEGKTINDKNGAQVDLVLTRAQAANYHRALSLFLRVTR